MIGSFKTWWDQHSASERGVMAVLGIAVAVVILWLGIYRPVEDGIALGWARQGAALDRYASVRSKVEALKRLPAKPPRTILPVEQAVTQSAAEAGFTLDKVGNAGGNGISVSIASARTEALLAWLSHLEQVGIAVKSISIVPGQTPGTVAVQAVFQDSGQ
jgi:general secretion pathway protein M